jgi:photosystem II stability/assembly factor-like uncharacterized protein
MLASGLQGAFVSTDRGNSWVQAKPVGNAYSFQSLTFAPRNAGIIFAATLGEGVLRTSDGGLSWEGARYGLSSDSILAVTLEDENAKTCFAWSPAGEGFRSTNRGLEWTGYGSPWTGRVRLVIAYDRLQPSSVVALVNGEDLYLSLSGGESWTKVHRELPRLEVNSLDWNGRTGRLYAGTRERGVYVMDLRQFLDPLREE